MAASARVTPIEPEDTRLTPAEATDLLPHFQTVHVLVGTVRARWERGDLVAALRAGRDHRLTLAARSAGFGLSFVRDSGESVLVQTDDARVRGWMERRTTKAAESNQEECSYLGIPCLLLRAETERREGLDENCVLSRFDPDIIAEFLRSPERYRRAVTMDSSTPSEVILEALAARAGGRVRNA